jgi:hypothetical protein
MPRAAQNTSSKRQKGQDAFLTADEARPLLDSISIVKAAGIEAKIGNHTFRATGITAYLKNIGKLKVAQHIANHESMNRPGRRSCTTGGRMDRLCRSLALQPRRSSRKMSGRCAIHHNPRAAGWKDFSSLGISWRH